MKILIVDDSRFSRSMLLKWFRQIIPEAVILEAAGGEEGISLFDREAPELIVTDLVMPAVTGDQVIRHIRALNQRCYIAVLSANIQTKVQQQMKAIGVDLFLEKPVTAEKVQTLVTAFQKHLSEPDL